MQPEEPIHPVYLPFSAAQLRSHFAPVADRDQDQLENHIQYFLQSARRYSDFCAQYPNREGMPLKVLRSPCQTEKDERFWTAACWMALYHHTARTALLAKLMRKAFSVLPSLGSLSTWEECFSGRLHLFFEAHLPSPASYKRWLIDNLGRRHLIPYVHAAAARSNGNLEGPTHADVLLVNEDNGFALIVEAKVESDISCDISFDLLRNQLVRCIDVALERNDTLPNPLSARDPERTLVILQTPALFRDNPSSRLYGWLFQQYRKQPEALGKQLQYRGDLDWNRVAERLGWLTWEDCCEVLPGACLWIK